MLNVITVEKVHAAAGTLRSLDNGLAFDAGVSLLVGMIVYSDHQRTVTEDEIVAGASSLLLSGTRGGARGTFALARALLDGFGIRKLMRQTLLIGRFGDPARVTGDVTGRLKDGRE